jgi:hypothetical protein
LEKEKFNKADLDILEDYIVTQLPDILTYVLESANESGRLRELLELLHLDRLLPQSYTSTPYSTGKILVFAGKTVKEKDLLGVAKSLGISKERFVFYDYEQAKAFQYDSLECNAGISAILFGSVPHKTVGTENNNSVIANIERKADEGIIWAPVVRLHANNELKLTKTNFREALSQLIDDGSIAVGS